MATFNKFNDYSEQKNRGAHDWGTHTFKWALTNTAPVATQTTWNLVDHPAPVNANGYTVGGEAVVSAVSEVAGVTTDTLTQAIFTATPGGIGPWRYAVLYNSSSGDKGVGWVDYGSEITLASGVPFYIKCNGTSPGTLFTDS